MRRLRAIHRQRRLVRHDARRAAIEQIYLAGIRRTLAHAQVEILHKLHAGMGKAKFLNAQFVNSDSVAADFMFDLGDFEEMFFVEMRKAGEEALEISGQGLLSELGIDRKYVTPRGLTHEFVIDRQNKLSGVPQEVYARVKATLEEGIRRGETMDELAGRVQAEMGQIDAGQAHTIAQTETASAYNTGRMDGMRRHGIAHKSWLTADDDRVRKMHTKAEADGAIPIDDKFSNGLMYPGDPEGGPAEVINCRCTLEAAEAASAGRGSVGGDQ